MTSSILLLIRALDTGGAQRQLVELALGLHRSGWKVTVATFYPGGALQQPLRDAGIPVRCLEKKGRWDVLPFMWRLVQLIRHERPHFAKSYLVMSNILLSVIRPALKGTRVVWGVAASDMDLRYYDFLAKIEFSLSILLSPFADSIICNSEAGRRYHVAKGYAAKRLVVIPNGVDTDHFRRDAISRNEVRNELRIAPGEKLVGLVGRVDPIKDYANFINAAARVLAVHPRTKFVCIGPATGSYWEQMVELSRTLDLRDAVIWTGERTDMWRVYNALDLLVSSSRSEGLPNVVAEAMASGVPCVVTDVGDSAHLVGDRSRVCPPADSQALAEAMLRAINSPPADPALLRQRICLEFSRSALIRRTAAHLCGMLTENARGRKVVSE